MSLASLYCFALLLDRSPTDEEEDGSVVPLEIPSVAPELFGLLDCGKEFSELLGSRDELDSVVDTLMLMGCVSSSPQLAQKKLATIRRDLLKKNLLFMTASKML